MAPTAPLEFEVVCDGDPIDMDKWTFEELDEYRALVRESYGDDTIDPAFAPKQDKWPAMYAVQKKRTDGDFTLEQAKKVVVDDMIREKKRPTRAAKGSRSKA